MSNDLALWQEWEGRIVPRGFSIGYIVLSYAVSYVGAWTTLELLNRRTSGKGVYNWYLLCGSSVSMGGIAIWCMHYISNRAIVLGDAQFAIQIAYSPAYTAVSFFVPITVLLVAFIVLGSDDRVSIVRVTVGGTLAGLAICGMHYMGQAGISNYTCVFNVGNVVGSVVIAVIASIVALSVFFVLRAAWTNSWWKRAVCAVILAGAVFGMHWTASIGTNYRLKQGVRSLSHSISRDLTVIVVIVLSITACFILLVFAILARRRRLRSANRAQHVVLASAIFDMHGRLLVTPEGHLPNQKVTTSYIERSLDDEFGVSHPIFQWMFRTTRNWSSISSLLPGMRSHLYNASTRRGSRASSKAEVNLGGAEGESPDDYSIIFREIFCVAAADLAEQLNEPLENIGILFDEILSTGQTTTSSKSKVLWNSRESSKDLESDGKVMAALGRGQLLFLVRRANRREAERFAASGYRFAEIQNVAHIITRSMQINCNDLQGRLASMRESSSGTNILKPGVHLACFAIRASVRGGFDVLIRKDARNELPTMQLPIDNLDSWQISFLSQLDGFSVKACLKFLKERLARQEITKREQSFAIQLYDALVGLDEEIGNTFFADALLIGIPISAPCYGSGGDNAKPAQAALITFRIIVPIQFCAQGLKVGFTPLSFFRTQQCVYRNSPDHARFARAIHKEFGPLVNKKRLSIKDDGEGLESGSSPGKFSRRLKRNVRGPLDTPRKVEGVPKAHTKTLTSLRFWNRKQSSREARASPKVALDSSSEIRLVETQTFGGIMVSQEVSIDIRDIEGYSRQRGGADDESVGTDIGGIQMGTTGEAMKEVDDSENFVDRLLAICIATRR
ncbi:hypothetical protein BKA65DRAFT_456864 [Rhexocercosporidium sp. MPI-PUGE-AT-0058]|nr:hypothetical protein BKA65DRAFT_456864 [Rhexocercosporidium sp. MPI-PUGE-AT-0058]